MHALRPSSKTHAAFVFSLANYARLHLQACAPMGGAECRGGGATRRRRRWAVGRQAGWQAAPHATCAHNGCHRWGNAKMGKRRHSSVFARVLACVNNSHKSCLAAFRGLG